MLIVGKKWDLTLTYLPNDLEPKSKEPKIRALTLKSCSSTSSASSGSSYSYPSSPSPPVTWTIESEIGAVIHLISKTHRTRVLCNSTLIQYSPSTLESSRWKLPTRSTSLKPQISEICNTSFSYRSFLVGCESENSHRLPEKNPFKNFKLLRIWIDFGTEELRFYTTSPL